MSGNGGGKRVLSTVFRSPVAWGLLVGAAFAIGARWLLGPPDTNPLRLVAGADAALTVAPLTREPQWASQELTVPLRLENRSDRPIRLSRLAALCKG